MHTKAFYFMCMCWCGITPLFAQALPKRSYLGVILDSQPIPTWLGQHLDLQPNQGIRVRNMHTQGPADQAGLQQDDILIELNGEPILTHRDFVNKVANSGIGNSITLTILRQGQRHQVTATLDRAPEQFQPKYTPEPQEVQSWRPVQGLRYDADQNKWILDTTDHTADELPKEIYQMLYNGGDHPIVVIISGSPLSQDSQITVQKGENRYQTVIKEIATLPSDLRDYAQRAVKQAETKKHRQEIEQTLRQHTNHLRNFWQEYNPEQLDEFTTKMMDNLKTYTEQLDETMGKPRLMLEDHRERLEQLEAQLQDALERIEKLEARVEE